MAARRRPTRSPTALGHPPEFVTSESGFVSRRTDRRTLEIFEMVYCGQLNKMWVEELQRRGVNAVGLSGLDGRVFEGKRKDTLRVRVNGKRMVLRDDWTGTVERVNTDLLSLLLDGGYFPVLTPPGASEQGEAINVDGDRAAAMVAAAFGAEALVILSNVPGLLRQFPDESSLIRQIPRAEADDFMQYAEGRMKKKVMGAVEAIGEGVQRVVFADGRIDRADPRRARRRRHANCLGRRGSRQAAPRRPDLTARSRSDDRKPIYGRVGRYRRANRRGHDGSGAATS